MDDPDYFRTALADLSGELDRLAANGAAKYELAAALSRCETVLMRLAIEEHHEWLCAEFQKIAEQHDIVAHCTQGGSSFVKEKRADRHTAH